MLRLEGKTCLVTAAGQGIGRASALAMAREGAAVIAADIDEKALGALGGEEGVEIETCRLDVCDPQAILALSKRIAAPDVLFNCAGFVAHGSILDCDEEEWDRSFTLNAASMYRMIRAFLPGMLGRGGGSIINMASAVSSLIAAPDRFVYGTTKAAVIGLTKSIAVDYVRRGIRCNAICPGTVESPSLEGRLAATGDYASARRAFIARQPIGRIGRPEEIAALVVYLASDESSYTTGSVHVIDGGWVNS